MTDIFIRNVSGGALVISDLSGCRIADTEVYELTRTRTLQDIFESVDLANFVNASDIEISVDGAAWLGSISAISLINEINDPERRKRFTSGGISINTSNSSSLDKINDSFTDQPAGDYLITFESSYSNDDNGSDIIIECLINGMLQGTSDEAFRIEPQDSGGDDGDGRDTNQKLSISKSYPYTLAADGNIPVVMRFNPSSNGVQSALWDSNIILEAIVNV